MSNPNLAAVFDHLNMSLLDILVYKGNINRLKHKALLYCHPDKHDQTESGAWAELTTKVNRIFDLLNAPSNLIEISEHLLMHTYTVSTTIGESTYTKTSRVTYTFGMPVINLETQQLIQGTFQLTDEELTQVNERFKSLILEFAKQIVAMRHTGIFDEIFFSSQQIDVDLRSLINGHHDVELRAKISALKSSQPKYHTFDTDINAHIASFTDFYNFYFNSDVFRKNLFKIYLKIASEQRHQTHWLLDKKTYANLAAILLKIPVFIVHSLMIASMIIFTMLLPIFLLLISLPPAAIALSTAFNTLLIWSTTIGSTIAISYFFNITMGEIIDFIEKPAILCANFIDWFVETIFNAKQHATELASILSEIQGDRPRETNLASASKLLKFGFMQSSGSHTEDHESSPMDEDISPRGMQLMLT